MCECTSRWDRCQFKGSNAKEKQQLSVKLVPVRAPSVTQDSAMILHQTVNCAEIQERHVKVQWNVVKAYFTYQGTSWSFHSTIVPVFVSKCQRWLKIKHICVVLIIIATRQILCFFFVFFSLIRSKAEILKMTGMILLSREEQMAESGQFKGWI